MPKNKCKGCASRVTYNHRKECKLTPGGIKDVEDCPCKDCLIKMTCSVTCDPFAKSVNEMAKKYMTGKSIKSNLPKSLFFVRTDK